MKSIEKVSVHGGHSGQFCYHATDSLEEIIISYIDKGFRWIGITEHTPALSEPLLYADEREAGLTPEFLLEEFGRYMDECRRLQKKYKSQIGLYAAMEIETYSGYEEFVPYLADRFKPDYIVGSVHFVADLNFDYSPEMYKQVARTVGGIDEMYHAYFDTQYEMIKLLKPAVVGHFDLIRIFDQDYRMRLQQPDMVKKIRRNLELIKDLDLILDFNLRSLLKGGTEPYISSSILELAREYDMSVVPGDDSHGLASVGNYFDKGVSILQQYGISTDWKKPLHE